MQLRSVLVIGLIFVVCLFAVFYTDKKGSEETEQETYSRELLTFDPGAVDELSIETESGKVVCQKVGEDWRIVEPLPMDAHRGTVQGVLANLERARLNRYLPLEEDFYAEVLEKYGLDVPHVTVSLRLNGAILDTVIYGDANPQGRYVYVKKASENRIGLVELYRRTGVDKTFSDLRHKLMLKFKKARVANLRIERQQGVLEVAKMEGEWQMKSPGEARGDGAEIDSLLLRLAAPVEAFVEDMPEDLEKYGLEEPGLRIDVTSAEGEVHSLLIGARHGDAYWAKDASRTPVFTINTTFVERLGTAGFDLRYKNLVEFKRQEIDRVEFVYPDSSILCVRDESIWLAVHQQRPANKLELEAIIFNVEKLKAAQFPALDAAGTLPDGLDAPRLHIRLWAGEDTVGDLAIGGEKEDMVFVRGSGNERVCLVHKEIADRLLPAAERIFAQK